MMCCMCSQDSSVACTQQLQFCCGLGSDAPSRRKQHLRDAEGC